MTHVPTARVRVDRHLSEDFRATTLAEDVRRGLSSTPKSLPPKWFYDQRGSELFEEITRLPEYYPTRAEASILRERAEAIAAVSTADTLVELGSGSSEKTRILLDALLETGSLRRYVPVDVSESALLRAGDAILADYPGLEVHAVLADFEHHLDRLPGGGRRLVAFLGGTIGNLLPEARADFLAQLRSGLEPGDSLLLGTGLVTDPDVLVRAYDDAAGVTADFDLNVLRVLRRELGATVDVEDFEHVAVWDPEREWIEMRLRARTAQRVEIPPLGLTVDFAAGEELRTEVSAKFRRQGVAAEVAAAGFRLDEWWTDPEERYALSLSTATA
ncbi:MAG TPA: L-histidine N(alpha)-methyltransferase [Mycobacteriales bacterium]|jgi:L-histidine N-alpha-methyltransferase|nr:L-histidine N(alpha)-methyltransferase [Mycobacteriales bacterium]